jgi:glutamate synthase (NADPH/NADH) small chain
MIEQAISDRAWAEGWIKPRPPAVRSGKKVAVIGSGPAGLGAAAELNYYGHEVTVFERNDKIGGLLRYGIPDFKLEKWIVERRVDLMAAEGVIFRTGVNAGVDVTVDELNEQFDAVVIAIGSTIPRDLPVPGRELDGVHFAMEYLELRNRWVSGEFGEDDGVVAVAQRLRGQLVTDRDPGAEDGSLAAHLVQPPVDRPDDLTPWPRWPLVLRTSGAHEEGGERRFSMMTTELVGEDGKVKLLRGHEVGPPPSFEKIEGTEFEIPAELVLLAMGFLHPQAEGLVENFGLDVDGRGHILDKDWATSRDGVFACGDARRGQSLVVWAISEGRQCAQAVDRWLAEQEAGGELDLVALAG